MPAVRLVLITSSISALSTPALADQPAPAPKPGVTIPAGQVAVTATVEVNASTDRGAEPVSLAPDVAYGVTADLTAILVHSTVLTTGFRGGGGRGLCVTGTDHGCARLYDNAGVEALLGVLRGPLAVAVDGGVHALSFDRGWYAAKVGARVRHRRGDLTLHASPSLFVAASERDDDDPTTVDNLDRLWLPIGASYAISRPLWVGVGTGVKGPLQGWGDAWELAAGVLAQYQIDPRIAAGASLFFGNVTGGDPDADPRGFDQRWIHVWVSYTRS
jgi:hypothetical protein